jgi:hypothetical protein
MFFHSLLPPLSLILKRIKRNFGKIGLIQLIFQSVLILFYVSHVGADHDTTLQPLPPAALLPIAHHPFDPTSVVHDLGALDIE